MALAWDGGLNKQGELYIDRIFKQALATFAVARTLNGLISVAQGTTLAVEPAGIGADFAFGEILDPINDLIEQFSWIMLASTTSLGIQKLLLEITGWWGIRVLLLSSVLLFVVCLWLPARFPWKGAPWVNQLLLLALLLNLAVPVVAALSNQVFEGFIKEKQQISISALESESEEFRQIEQSLPSKESEIEERSWHEEISALIGEVQDSLNFRIKIQQLKVKSEKIAEHIIALIVVFVLQTIVLPLTLFWLLLRFIGRIGR